MDASFDESNIMYGLGAFLGIISILYFGHELILDLSPTIKSFMLLSGTAMFLVLGEVVRNSVLKTSTYIFSAFAYLSFLTYLFARFNPTSGQTFALLAASSAVFVLLGYVKSEEIYKLDSDQSKKILAAVIALIAVVVVFDTVGSQPEYDLELKESLEVLNGEEFKLGTLQIRNDFALSRNIDVPTFNGCLITPDGERRGVYVSPDGERVIRGGSTETFDLAETVRSRHENQSISENYTIENRECPESPEKTTIYLHEGGSSMVRSIAD